MSLDQPIEEMSQQMARTYTIEQLRIIVRTNDPILPHVQAAKNALKILKKDGGSSQKDMPGISRKN